MNAKDVERYANQFCKVTTAEQVYTGIADQVVDERILQFSEFDPRGPAMKEKMVEIRISDILSIENLGTGKDSAKAEGAS